MVHWWFGGWGCFGPLGFPYQRDCYLRGTWIRIPKHFQPSVFCWQDPLPWLLRCAGRIQKRLKGPISVAQEIGFRFRLCDFCGKKPWVSQRSLRKELFLGTHKKVFGESSMFIPPRKKEPIVTTIRWDFPTET